MISVRTKRDTGVCPVAITSAEGCGRARAAPIKVALTSTCMARTHHRLVLIISTKGLQKGLITHGRYRILVYAAISGFDMPIFLNMIVEIVFTMK